MTTTRRVEVAEAQLKAYNARNIDEFMSYWHPDAECFTFPDQPLAVGWEAVRKHHVVRFGDDALFADVLERLVLEDLIVDHELVTRTFPEGIRQVEVLSIYAFEDGLIRKAWFRQGVARA